MNWPQTSNIRVRKIVFIVVSFLLVIGVACAFWWKSSDSALISASGKGDIATVKKLLGEGANPNKNDKNSTTSLISAAYGGHADVVKLLLDKGADPNAKFGNGETSLMLSENQGYADVVKMLLDKGADLNAKKESDGA